MLSQNIQCHFFKTDKYVFTKINEVIQLMHKIIHVFPDCELNMAGVSMPPNFSWAVDGLLAGLAFPSREEHFKYLESVGITYLVSLVHARIRIPSGNL